jgi:hypothetical protein
MKAFLGLLLFFSLSAAAQDLAISGKVINLDSKLPLSGATVFLSNTSFQTATLNDGSFSLTDLKPGQYTLVVNFIGYKSHTQQLLLNSSDDKFVIALSPASIQLQEVNINAISKATYKKYYAQFIEEFIGDDKNASDCEIINPEIINFKFDKATNTLEAYANDFLIVKNNALGYKIKFLIEKFAIDNSTGIVNYIGLPLFEEIQGNTAQITRWLKQRDEAYYGSPMHFYRSVINNNIASEGFKVYHLDQQLKPVEALAPPKRKAQVITRVINLSSIYYNEQLSKTELKASDLLKTINTPGIFALNFPHYLYVVYTKKQETEFFKDVYKPTGRTNYQTSIVSLPNNEKISFDKNGVVVNNALVYIGSWTQNRLSRLLPYNFSPVK